MGATLPGKSARFFIRKRQPVVRPAAFRRSSRTESDIPGFRWFSRGMAFEIHPRLASGGFEIGTLGGCRLLLKNNALFPWLILVPEVEGIEDLHQLPPDRYDETMAAMRRVSAFVASYFQPEKLNLGCIGNQVRQMHVQIVGRSQGDPAWPGTVWAYSGKRAYTDGEVVKIRAAAREFLEM
jgi:diadenosine tetraphosphate (Ap4A) HIT family hydrolase